MSKSREYPTKRQQDGRRARFNAFIDEGIELSKAKRPLSLNEERRVFLVRAIASVPLALELLTADSPDFSKMSLAQKIWFNRESERVFGTVKLILRSADLSEGPLGNGQADWDEYVKLSNEEFAAQMQAIMDEYETVDPVEQRILNEPDPDKQMEIARLADEEDEASLKLQEAK